MTISQKNFLRVQYEQGSGFDMGGAEFRGCVNGELIFRETDDVTDILRGLLPQPWEACLVSPGPRQRMWK